jgi:hypothetical protein
VNFKLDLKSMTIETKLESEITMSDCGWDVGRDWFCLFAVGKLLAKVENCLKNKITKR